MVKSVQDHGDCADLTQRDQALDDLNQEQALRDFDDEPTYIDKQPTWMGTQVTHRG